MRNCFNSKTKLKVIKIYNKAFKGQLKTYKLFLKVLNEWLYHISQRKKPRHMFFINKDEL